jgi:hypothetical protein
MSKEEAIQAWQELANDLMDFASAGGQAGGLNLSNEELEQRLDRMMSEWEGCEITDMAICTAAFLASTIERMIEQLKRKPN